MAIANYKAIKGLLARQEPFTGNSMRAIKCEGRDRDGDYISHMGMLYTDPDARALFAGETFDYLVLSYGTPIAGVTSNGDVIVNDTRYSTTTSRHQGLVRTYLT